MMQERQSQVDADPAGGFPTSPGRVLHRRWHREYGFGVYSSQTLGVRRSSADEVIARLRPKLEQISGVSVYLQSNQDIRVGGRFSRTQYQYTLQDANIEELREWAPKMVDQLKKLPELRDVASDQQTAGIELAFAIDRDTASRFGISPQNIDDALYDAYGSVRSPSSTPS